jgi:TnpA family transposase
VINISADSKVLDFLRLLEEYRRKCEEEGNYAEARKSRAKFDELLKKETIRQKNNIKAA